MNNNSYLHHLQRNSPRPSPSFSSNENLLNTTSINSPLTSSQFGCTSIIPPVTSSSASSTPSQEQYPDGSIDSLILNLLQIVDRIWFSSSCELKVPVRSEAQRVHRPPHHGSIFRNYPGPAEDRTSLRERKIPLPIGSKRPQPQTISLGQVSIGRPIPGNPFPVIVRNPCGTFTPLSQTIRVFGNDGAPEDNLCRPWGIACDREGHVIVADRSNNRIQIYKEDGSFVRRFGNYGTGPVQFDRPAGVAVDCRRRIIVADKDNHRIQILTIEGHFILSFGKQGTQVGQFNYPWDVATNSECQIVVSDTRNHRIQLFTSGGLFLRKYGYEAIPSMLKYFDSPRGVAFNPDGNVIVTDFNNHRLVIINADFKKAQVLECDSRNPDKSFLRPQGIVVDDEGNIVVADSKNSRIQVLNSLGNVKWTFGSFGEELGEMNSPSGIALTTSGRIAVIDFGNNRVLII